MLNREADTFDCEEEHIFNLEKLLVLVGTITQFLSELINLPCCHLDLKKSNFKVSTLSYFLNGRELS